MQPPQQASQQVSPEVQQLLDQLEPVACPPDIGFWPPAIGWWMLLAMAALLLALWIYRLILRHRRLQFKRDAQTLFDALPDDPGSELIFRTNEILKRAALQAQPVKKSEITQAFGQQWIELMHELNPAHPLPESCARALGDGGYDAVQDFNAGQLKAAAKEWVKTLPVKRGGKRNV